MPTPLVPAGDRISMSVGSDLRRARLRRRLTLEQLAASAGLTRSYVSKIERGLASPSSNAVRRLSIPLGIDPDRLPGSEAAPDPVSITRARSGVVGDPGAHLSLIAGQDPLEPVCAYLVRPSSITKRGRLMSDHDGREVLFVLTGAIELLIGRRREILNVGDCASYRSTMPHRFTSLSAEPASALLIVVKAGSA